MTYFFSPPRELFSDSQTALDVGQSDAAILAVSTIACVTAGGRLQLTSPLLEEVLPKNI